MAHSLQARKRVRQNEKNRIRNKAVKTGLKNEIKQAGTALKAKNVDDAKKSVLSCQSHADKAVKKGVIHRKKAARIKSKLAKRLNDITKK